MKYFLILGTNPALSIAEIDFYFKKREVSFDLEIQSKDVVFLQTKTKLDLEKIIKELGGVIKAGEVLCETKKIKVDNFVDVLGSDFQDLDYKFKFGFSFYGGDTLPLNSIAMNLKKILKEKNISSRWVISKEKSLSSVIVEQNKLVDKGVDFFIYRKASSFFLGKTLAVQDFKGLSRRDYGRPARDDESGMIPPKLAQIMINISGAQKDDYLLDPFCGSGTILAEEVLLGIKNIWGSDSSEKAVQDSRKNINWLLRTAEQTPNLHLDKIDATKISTKMERFSIDAIVTEPYLGPQRGAHDIRKTVASLEDLYSKSLEEFSKILKKEASVVMVWPVFVSREGNKKKYFLENINIDKYKTIPLLSEKYLNNEFAYLSRRGGIVYGRPGQKIWREIVLLKLT
ncbi:MAG: DNA methyltransferase [Patescibacteria group bacterium]|jgi:tRNA G10  N-methylase Trm11|nr:DNA methyltransferase [Patescibacteria group bacterium]